MSSYIQSKLAKDEKLQIFVTGATGYIGTAFTKHAIAAGHAVHGLSRTEDGDLKLKALGAAPVRGDLTAHDVLAREAAAADAVVHLAYVHDFSQDQNKIAELDIAAVNTIAASLANTGKPLITASGCGGYQVNADKSELTEDQPNNMGSRLRTEENVLGKADVHAVVLRLAPYVYGRGGPGFLKLWMQKAVELGESLYIGDGTKRTSTLYIDDAAKLYLAAVQFAGAREVYNAIGSNATTLKQMAEAVGEVLNLPAKTATFEEVANKWSPFLAGFNYKDLPVSNKKARDQLKWEPKGPAFLDDIVNGSYQEVAVDLKAQAAKV